MGLSGGLEIRRLGVLEPALEQEILRPHGVILDGQVSGDARQVGVVLQRIVILFSPIPGDFGAERQRAIGRTSTQEGCALLIVDTAYEQVPIAVF